MTTNSASEISLLNLSIPMEANSYYLVLATAQINISAAVGDQLMYLNFYENASQKMNVRWRQVSTSNPQTNVYATYVNIVPAGANAIVRNIELKGRAYNTSQYVTFKEMEIFGLRLNNIMATSQFNYSALPYTSDIDKVFGDDAGDRIETSITPNASGEYLIMHTGLWRSASTSSNVTGRIVVDGVAVNTLPYGIREDTTTGDQAPVSFIYLANFTTTVQHNISVQFADGDTTASADLLNHTLVIFRIADTLPFRYNYVGPDNSVASTTFGNMTKITIGPDKGATYAVLSGYKWKGASSTSYDALAKLMLNSTQLNWEKYRQKDVLDFYNRLTINTNLTITNASTDIYLQHAREDATGTGLVANATLIAFAYNWTAAGGAATSCTCPASGTAWPINLADNCVIATNCDIGTGLLSLYGDGSLTLNAGIIIKALTSSKLSNLTGTDKVYMYGKFNFTG